jgi:hypothetical protein
MHTQSPYPKDLSREANLSRKIERLGAHCNGAALATGNLRVTVCVKGPLYQIGHRCCPLNRAHASFIGRLFRTAGLIEKRMRQSRPLKVGEETNFGTTSLAAPHPAFEHPLPFEIEILLTGAYAPSDLQFERHRITSSC